MHFRVGKKDGEKKGLKWALTQLLVVPRFVRAIMNDKTDLVYLNTDLTRASILRDFFLFTAARYILGKKVLLHIHGGHFLMTPPSRTSLFFHMIRKMLTGASICIVLSEIEQQAILTNFGAAGIALPNAIKISEASNRGKNFNNKLQIIFLGRVVKSKGVHIIASSLKNLNPFFEDFDFNIYGSGPELDILLSELDSVKGLSYNYHGVVQGPEKWKALEAAHIFLLPSLFGEGLPIAMLEAMGRGCIPIVSDDASISSVVDDNVNGFIVTKGDDHHLATTIQKLIQNRKDLPGLSESAQTTIRSRYNIESYLNRLNAYCAAI